MALLSAQWQPKGLTVSACLTLILDYVLFYCLSKHWSHFVTQADFELSVIFLYLCIVGITTCATTPGSGTELRRKESELTYTYILLIFWVFSFLLLFLLSKQCFFIL